MTIDRWAESHELSRAFFYVLEKQGKAPRTYNVGKCRRISDEADLEWVRAREAESIAAAS
jgi:hypothetical protein